MILKEEALEQASPLWHAPPVKDAVVAVPPEPKEPDTDTSEAGADATDAFNRKAFEPLSSPNAVTAVEVSEESTKLSVTAGNVVAVVVCATNPPPRKTPGANTAAANNTANPTLPNNLPTATRLSRILLTATSRKSPTRAKHIASQPRCYPPPD